MRLRSKGPYLGFLMINLVGFSSYAEIYVIAHPQVTLTSKDIKEIYTGEKQSSGTLRLTPVDNAAAIEEFAQKVLNKPKLKYEIDWQKKSFRDGTSPPVTKANDVEVSAFVKSTEGAVGYISSTPPAGVTIVQKFP